MQRKDIQWKASWNRCVFSWDLKEERDGAFLRSAGREFQMVGAKKPKDPWLKVFKIRFWNFKQFFIWRSERTGWLVSCESLWQIEWKGIFEITVIHYVCFSPLPEAATVIEVLWTLLAMHASMWCYSENCTYKCISLKTVTMRASF